MAHEICDTTFSVWTGSALRTETEKEEVPEAAPESERKPTPESNVTVKPTKKPVTKVEYEDTIADKDATANKETASDKETATDEPVIKLDETINDEKSQQKDETERVTSREHVQKSIFLILPIIMAAIASLIIVIIIKKRIENEE